MAERLIVVFWLHEPSGGATFDDLDVLPTSRSA
jgi:hypothetical protein